MTPETLDEWRKDAERDHARSSGIGYPHSRILTLLDALAVEKAAREEAERTTKQAVVLQRMAEDEAESAERAAAAQMQHGAKQYQRAEVEKARADKAEQEVERLKGVCNDWGNNYQSWVNATKKAEQERNALVAGINALADDGSKLGTSGRLLIWPEELRALIEKDKS